MRTTLTAVALLLAGTAAQAGMRCDGALVREGDTVQELIEDCGQPDRKWDNVNDYNVVVSRRWEYDMGEYKNTRQLLIRGGTIVRLETLTGTK